MEKGWNGLPYLPISRHYQKTFGEKVYKIPVAIADDCPNRLGINGMQTCVFCDEWGSAARAESLTMELRSQIETFHQQISDRYKAKTFVAYFQAYTSTFLKLQKLQNHIETALSYPFIRGVVIGTRPDCLSQSVLQYWSDLAKRNYVSIEFGVQTFKDEQLKFLRRGHTSSDSFNAILKTAKIHPQLHLGIHLIFGLPNETDMDVIEAAEICNQLPIHSVKLHHLHVLKNTPLADMYAQGEFQPIDFPTYSRRVRLFLERLSPLIYVNRLAAYSSRWEELIAPDWTANKMLMHQQIVDDLRNAKTYQSRLYLPASEHEKIAQQELSFLAQPSCV